MQLTFIFEFKRMIATMPLAEEDKCFIRAPLILSCAMFVPLTVTGIFYGNYRGLDCLLEMGT